MTNTTAVQDRVIGTLVTMRAPLALLTLVYCLIILGGCGPVSQEQEREFGAADAAHVDSALPLIQDSVVTQYVASLGKAMASRTSRADLDWRFKVVDSKEVNAFALPGGFIYVNRAVIEQADRMDELAGIMGHEIGHVVRRHSVKQFQQQEKGRLGLVVLCTLTTACIHLGGRIAIAIGSDAARAQYSQADEAEADSEGVVNTVKSGIDPEGLPSFFQRMLEARKTQPTAVDAFFSTHPTDQSRVNATRKQIESLHLDPSHPLQRDTALFHEIQKRVRAMPPPPEPEKNP
ncbi:MAG TPA: M48 family metallopeptidase [Gemmatimonadaceae bacterium]|nr:M48 family metallopeptidase [Gemmatimonadaceae bacterium]